MSPKGAIPMTSRKEGSSATVSNEGGRLARPNILLVLVDEQRYPPCYEGPELARYRREQLRAQELLRSNGIEWHRHYVMSTACVPSRASLFTGQYPSFHGVSQTDGAAKSATDPSMHWLDPDGAPTLGDYFRTAGYRTLYHGKWHVSHADLIDPESGHAVPSSDARGKPIPDGIAAYERAGRLEPFGFSGWIGPEPHGAEPANCGLRRDPLYVDQAIASLDALERERSQAKGTTAPWLMVCSLVNPHDIVLFGLGWLRVRAMFKDDTVPDIHSAPTRHEDLDTKPTCHASYVKTYPRMLAPQPTIALYRKFYYYLHKLVDAELMRLYERLRRSPFFENTIVVFTSDHGELLGAHGGMHQKWHNAYEETIRVPLIFSSPLLGTTPRSVNRLSSHADLLPTLLGLAGVDPEATRARLAKSHDLAHALPGRDLSDIVRGRSPGTVEEPIYFMTDDEVSEGLRSRGALGFQFEPVSQPCRVEAVVARVDGRLWKYARYLAPDGHDVPMQYELYDLEADPTESTNLAHVELARPASNAIRARLEDILALERTRKRVRPAGRISARDSAMT